MTREQIIEELKTQENRWYEEEDCLEAVKRDGDALKYVNRKTFGVEAQND